MARSEWFLAIQILEFQNLHDAEIRNNYFCCCDDGNTTCAGADINAVNNMECLDDGTNCQPYYVLRVNYQGCPSTDTMCSVSEPTDKTVMHTFVTTSFLPHLHVTLNQSELEMYNQVRNCD